jgi:hypothetical protein
MATVIKPKRSDTAAAVPVSGDLAVGEIAINSADKKIYVKNANGTIVDLLSGAGSLVVSDTDTTGTVQNITFADSIDGLFAIDTTTTPGTAIVSLNISSDRDYGLITQEVGSYNSIDYGTIA